jgi:hypothetical protein
MYVRKGTEARNVKFNLDSWHYGFKETLYSEYPSKNKTIAPLCRKCVNICRISSLRLQSTKQEHIISICRLCTLS